MKTKMTKMLSLFLTSTIVLSACGDTSDTDSSNQNREDIVVNTEGHPIVDETLTLNLMAPGVGMSEWDEMPTLTEYSELTNI